MGVSPGPEVVIVPEGLEGDTFHWFMAGTKC